MTSMSPCFAFDSEKTLYPMPDNLSKREVDAILSLFEEEEASFLKIVPVVGGDVEVVPTHTTELHNLYSYNEQEASGLAYGLQIDDISNMGSLRYDSSDTEYDYDDDDEENDHMLAAHDDTMVDGRNYVLQPQQVPFLSENDVLFGRGGQCARSIGHQNYLHERNRLCIDYHNASDNTTKRLIQTQLIQSVHDSGGRFLVSVEWRDANDRSIQFWQVVPNGPRLYKKVAQALREGKPAKE